ncbi:hypothetical protein HPB47_017705 [Ixodes persulcatus]|uniref:Uncharacterized protein n=1 Tax=Ixodes persulcatus TaxID=34615 RepID=A0AC60QNL1_IXOPE|nr:hypothetical protein HPB47_017705 [Ixodes persulcatus]
MIQETLSVEMPRLPGYWSHDSPPSARDTSKGKGRGVCTFVRKGITLMEHELIGRSAIEHCTVEVITGWKRKESTFLVNVYSNASHGQLKFKALFHKASRVAGSNTLVVCGDFNAPNQDWGYQKTTVKGRKLMQDATDVGLNLITDPAFPTRIGTSVTRDTTPDLTFIKTDGGSRDAEWRNTGQELKSNHCIVEVVVPLKVQGNTGIRKHRITDWDAFRTALPAVQQDISDIEQWAANVVETTAGATKELETDERIDKMDSRLAHLIEAKQSIKARWQKQRTNRRLRKKIAELNSQIEAHCKVLCTQQWNEACNEADGQIQKGKTWNMLRHLLDDTKTKGHQHNNLARILHRAICEHGEDEVKRRLDAKYCGILDLEPREGKQQTNVHIPDSINRKLRVRPIPRNVNPDHNKERRLARARALVDLHAREEGAVYVDAEEYRGSCDAYAAVVVGASTGATKTAASVRTRSAPGGRVKNYAKGRVYSKAARILRKAKDIGRKKAVVIKWFPAHMGSDVSERGNANHNETANAAA